MGSDFSGGERAGRGKLVWTGVALVFLSVGLMLPVVQLTIARTVAASISGVDLQFERLWVGPWGGELKGLTLNVPSAGLAVTLGRANVEFDFWSSLRRWQIAIDTASLEDFDIVLQVTEDSEPATEVPDRSSGQALQFNGLAPFAHLPRWLAVRALEARGEMALNFEDDLTVASSWDVDADSWQAGSVATVNLASTTDAKRREETLATVIYRVSATATIDSSSRINTFELDSNVQPFGDAPGVRVAATVGISEGRETYHFNVEGSEGKQLLHVAGRYRGAGELEVDWEANVDRGVVSRFARGRSTADLSGRAVGSLLVDLAAPALEIDSSVQLTGSGWEAFDPRLSEFGALELDFDFVGTVTPGTVDSDQLQLRVSSTERGEMLRIDSQQGLRYQRGAWLVEPEVWGEPALQVRMLAVPVHWLGTLGQGYRLAGGEVSGAIEFVRQEARSTQLLVREPLRLTGLRLAEPGRGEIITFDMTLVPRAALREGVLEASIDELLITADTGLEVKFEGTGRTSNVDWPRAVFDGRVSAVVPRLQRVIPPLQQVNGSVHLQFDFETLLLIVETASVVATSPEGRELLTADLASRQPLRIALPQFTPDWDGLDAQSATLRLDRVPVDWLSSYIPELEFRGGLLSCTLTAKAQTGHGLTLGSDGPVVIENLLPVFRGRPARDTSRLSVTPQLRFGSAETVLSLKALTLESVTGNSLYADIELAAPQGGDRLTMDLSLNADIAELAAHQGVRLAGLQWRQVGELYPEARRYEVEQLALRLEGADGGHMVLIENLQPFTVQIDPFSIAGRVSKGDLFRAQINPLSLEKLLPNFLGLELEGQLPQGSFFGREGPEGGLVLATGEPLQFRDVSVRWGGAPLLDRVSASVDYELGYSASGLEARNIGFVATDVDGRSILRANSEIVAPLRETRLLNEVKLTVSADLNALTHQPILSDVPQLTRGVLEATLRLSHGGTSALSFSAKLEDAATAAGALPEADVDLQAEGVWGEHMQMELPVRLESDEFGESHLGLRGSLSRAGAEELQFEASLEGDRIALPDVQRLLALFQQAETEAGGDSQSPGVTPLSSEQLSAIAKLRSRRDQVPAWSDRANGQITIDLGVLASPAGEVRDIRARLDVSPDRLLLTDLHASAFGAEVISEARIGFAPDEPLPYHLNLRTEIPRFDVGQAFLSISPTEPPMLDGRFGLLSSLSGRGRNPLDLILSTSGKLELSGREGTFRGLAAREGTGSTAARIVGVLTFSRELKAIARLLDGLGEIRFHEADLLFERSDPDMIELRRLSVLSPQIQISAEGRLFLAPERALLVSPVELSAQLAATGDLAVLFDGMGLLEGRRDKSGFRDLNRAVNIRGTLAEPDTSEFWELLEEGSRNARGVFGVGLRALNQYLISTSKEAAANQN